MKHPYGAIFSTKTDPTEVPKIVFEHDRLLGAFVRLFATAESCADLLIANLMEVKSGAAGFLLSKVGAGQKIPMLKKIAIKSDDSIKNHILNASKLLGAANEFRIKISHQTIAVVDGRYTLLQHGADVPKYFEIEEHIDADTLFARCEELSQLNDLLMSILQHRLGDKRPVLDILNEMPKRSSGTGL